MVGKNSIPAIYYRYFVYSTQEEERIRKYHGHKAELGTVMVKGIPKKYTSIITDMSQSASDSIIVTQGDIRKIRYTPLSK